MNPCKPKSVFCYYLPLPSVFPTVFFHRKVSFSAHLEVIDQLIGQSLAGIIWLNSITCPRMATVLTQQRGERTEILKNKLWEALIKDDGGVYLAQTGSLLRGRDLRRKENRNIYGNVFMPLQAVLAVACSSLLVENYSKH